MGALKVRFYQKNDKFLLMFNKFQFMKKLFLITSLMLVIVIVNAQSLDEIVKKYTVANQLYKVSGLHTLKVTATMTAGGKKIPTEMWIKNPDKIKTVTDFNGQQVVQAFDGEKGYSINPIMGLTEPVEMSALDVTMLLRSNFFQNYIEDYLKKGCLSLEGDESVNGSPAHKIKATIDGGMVLYFFIDKTSGLLVKNSATMNAQGKEVTIDQFHSDFRETNGVFIPMKTTLLIGEMEIITTISKIEVDVPIDDSIFKLK
jgi:outer membrane lipoprotein-sorting protein